MKLLAKVGDRVAIQGIGKGTIERIRFDDSAREIYTVRLDKPEESFDYYYARHEELIWL